MKRTCETCHVGDARWVARRGKESWVVCSGCQERGARLVNTVTFTPLDTDATDAFDAGLTETGFPAPDPAAGIRQQHLAEQAVEAATPAVWRQAARQAIAEVARVFPTFSTDEVWDFLREHHPTGWKPPEPRAMSGIVRWALGAGLIEFTGQMRSTSRPEAHRNPKRTYRSLNVAHR